MRTEQTLQTHECIALDENSSQVVNKKEQVGQVTARNFKHC